MNSIAAYYALVVSDRAPRVDRTPVRPERPSLIQRIRALLVAARPASSVVQSA